MTTTDTSGKGLESLIAKTPTSSTTRPWAA
jgi:hypothetical protein